MLAQTALEDKAKSVSYICEAYKHGCTPVHMELASTSYRSALPAEAAAEAADAALPAAPLAATAEAFALTAGAA